MLGSDRSGTSDQIAHDWTAWVVAKPFGQWIVGAIGAATAAIGLGIGIAGVWGEFRRPLELEAKERRLVVALGRFGFVARSLVFTMIGLFLLYARIRFQFARSEGFCRSIAAHSTAAPRLRMAWRDRRGRINAPSLHQAAAKRALAGR